MVLAVIAGIAAGVVGGCASDAGVGSSIAETVDASSDAVVADPLTLEAAAIEAGGDAGDAAVERRPILFVHGINGSAADFAVMVDKLASHGWPRDGLEARTLPDPKWGCNVDNAKTIAGWANALLARSGAKQIDLVVHSMGGLSSRFFMKHLGGAALVRTYVSLGSMHHGLANSCFSPLDVCVWKELCQSGPFVADLDAPPATPGPSRWVSIFSTEDGTVPVASSKLAPAAGVDVENVQLAGITHSGTGGLLEAPLALGELEHALLAP